MLESSLQRLLFQGRFVFSVPDTHPSYEGHFPGFPIVPGVLCIAWIFAALLREKVVNDVVTQLNAVKFLVPVYPGDQLNVEYTLQDNKLTLIVIKNELKAVSVLATLNKLVAQ